MFADLIKPKENAVALILRIGLAAIFIVHGYIKIEVDLLLAPDTMSMTSQRVVGWLEMLSGLLLLVGLCTRIACLVVIVLQVAAIALVTGKYAMEGVRVAPKGNNYMLVGPEYNFVLIAMCLALLILGAGAASLDHRLKTQLAPRNAGTGELPAPAASSSIAPTVASPVVPVTPPANPSEKPTGSVPAA